MAKKIIENERPVFPFTAIIGQEEMKLALILNVIDPKIGGVMIMGDRGTGKSTTIRAVADLLPAIQVAANDPFNSSTTDFELMSEEVKQAVENIKEIGGFESIDLKFDLSLARGLNYYTGTIFELIIPNFREIGSIGGGGRYDNLTESFGKKNLSGVGISIGFERLMMVMQEFKLFPDDVNNAFNFYNPSLIYNFNT